MSSHRIPPSGFTKHTLAQIRNILHQQGWPIASIDEKVEAIRKERAALKAQKLKLTRSVTYWRYLRTPLKREIDVCRTSMEYIERKVLREDELDEVDTARRDAYEAYRTVLMRLIEQFDLYTELNPSMTPIQVIAQEQERGKLKYVTQGEHWADWVPPKVKDRVRSMFLDIPYRKQAKVKVPFERKVPKGSQRSRRVVLEQAMAKELETLTVKHGAYAPNDTMSEDLREEMLTQQTKIMAKMRKIKLAQARLAQKQDNKPFPVTWHGLLTDEENGDA
jgi:hypothetical protein